MNIDLSLIVPCYNEERNLPLLFEKICSTLTGINFEIIFINDGSADNTWKTLKEISHVLEVSESRISQLHTRALQKMKQKLGSYMGLLGE